MKKMHGKKIYFIVVNNYNAIRDILLKSHFVENEDFINGINFLNEQQRHISFNTYFVVRNM